MPKRTLDWKKYVEDWVPLESRTKAGAVYYYNVKTDKSTWKRPRLEKPETPKIEYLFVPDAEFFMSEILAMRRFLTLTMDGGIQPQMFLPKETMDEIEDRVENSGEMFSRAVAVLQTIQSKKHLMHKQTAKQAENWCNIIDCSCLQDSAVACCVGLQRLKEERARVFLLTKNKQTFKRARYHDVAAYDFEGLMKIVKLDSDFKYEDLKESDPNAGTISKLEKRTSEMNALIGAQRECVYDIKGSLKDVYKIIENAVESLIYEMYERKKIERPSYQNVSLSDYIEEIFRRWNKVFSKVLDSEDKEILEILLERAKRPCPLSFEIDKKESIFFISIVEELLLQIQKQVPLFEFELAHVKRTRRGVAKMFENLYKYDCELELNEEKDIQELLYEITASLNHLCAHIMKHYDIRHNFFYYDNRPTVVSDELEHVQKIILPAVIRMKDLFKRIDKNLDEDVSIQEDVTELTEELLKFIPSFYLPFEPHLFVFVSPNSMESWLEQEKNRARLKKMIEFMFRFLFKLQVAEKLRKGQKRGEIKKNLENIILKYYGGKFPDNLYV